MHASALNKKSINTTRMHPAKNNRPLFTRSIVVKTAVLTKHAPTVLNRFVPRPPRWFWPYKHGTQSLLYLLFSDLQNFDIYIYCSFTIQNKRKNTHFSSLFTHTKTCYRKVGRDGRATNTPDAPKILLAVTRLRNFRENDPHLFFVGVTVSEKRGKPRPESL
jgi:hypothetical protein